MKNEALPSFSLSEALEPPEGWRTDGAVFSTYSADFIVIVTTLLALSGCDLDHRRTGSRVELVKAIEALQGRVCFLAQAGRVAIPRPPRPILKLLDKFLKTINTDEHISSWHPKMAVVRYCNAEDPADFHWRVWIGSRNLTRSVNWETGLLLMSRSDGKGQSIEGLAETAQAFAARAKLSMLPAKRLGVEFSTLTWDCPAGSDIHRISLLGPGRNGGFPKVGSDTERMFLVSPFLDRLTVEAAGNWGNAKTKRTLVSTAPELARLYRENDKTFHGFTSLRTQPLPELPLEGADPRLDDDPSTNTVDQRSEGEEPEPLGLHAKLYFAAKGARRQLWVGSPNATQRGWEGRNHEIVAQVSVGRDTADALEEFVARCAAFDPSSRPLAVDEDEDALEDARKLLSGRWNLTQTISYDECIVRGSTPTPISDPTILLEVSSIGGTWLPWPHGLDHILLPTGRSSPPSDFLQLRVSRGEKMCAWVQIAPCDPPADKDRDTALIAEYLDPHTFLAWLRSLLAEEPARNTGGDWDADEPDLSYSLSHGSLVGGFGQTLTVEEILRAWAHDPSSFSATDEKVTRYLHELERRAEESGAKANLDLLQAFRRNWEALAPELR